MIEDITDRPIWVDLKGKDPHPLGLSEDAGDNDSYKRRCCCSYGVARYYVYIYIYIYTYVLNGFSHARTQMYLLKPVQAVLPRRILV